MHREGTAMGRFSAWMQHSKQPVAMNSKGTAMGRLHRCGSKQPVAMGIAPANSFLVPVKPPCEHVSTHVVSLQASTRACQIQYNSYALSRQCQPGSVRKVGNH